MIIPFIRRQPRVAVALATAGAGIVAALHYYRLGLTLSHYDARGHLVVARRIIDSLTPGWEQIGAVWLPLPHLLNALPVQIDLFYRTGASGVAISIAAQTLAAVSIFAIVRWLTASLPAALVAAAFFALNPNVLYLQSTPMTEPLLLGLTMLGLFTLLRVQETSSPRVRRRAGIILALACLTRYEAWPLTACGIAAAGWADWRQGRTSREIVTNSLATALYPAAAIVGFMIFSRIVIGAWFVRGGFFVPEVGAQGKPLVALQRILWGVREVSGWGLTAAAGVGIAILLWRAIARRDRAADGIALAAFATAALPFVAFFDGHPYRIRYMVPLVAAEAIAAGVAVGLIRRSVVTVVVGVSLAALVVFERPPLDARAAMVAEARWDLPNVAQRQPVTDYLRSAYHGEIVMASMGSLGHYMQDLSAAGLDLRDFLHEGNGDLWKQALRGPRPFAGWILIEEKAEGGDMLATLARENPRFLDGFSRVSEGAGVALYQRQNRMLNVAR